LCAHHACAMQIQIFDPFPSFQVRVYPWFCTLISFAGRTSLRPEVAGSAWFGTFSRHRKHCEMFAGASWLRGGCIVFGHTTCLTNHQHSGWKFWNTLWAAQERILQKKFLYALLASSYLVLK
jgi:hypothetical protein